ncbi:uncharacterized protein MONBRDRAFT_9496 [Monosiga brevicollis MX1]|uniref:Uncharacterized protein n=1 Tax=Monosiga brevicollis TaxID=81824 RepID=A9V3B9_MONBE|nr:uncharacterized protein MONBRDRAFT_9496 [Monosiga brevicollis MX1]EDQ88161.1 predicted protein [Monosiga brevicollis MX1]|eukprot:XP_001747237.1 hypothetical protein [Monosiga brevicollis MX1]
MAGRRVRVQCLSWGLNRAGLLAMGAMLLMVMPAAGAEDAGLWVDADGDVHVMNNASLFVDEVDLLATLRAVTAQNDALQRDTVALRQALADVTSALDQQHALQERLDALALCTGRCLQLTSTLSNTNLAGFGRALAFDEALMVVGATSPNASAYALYNRTAEERAAQILNVFRSGEASDLCGTAVAMDPQVLLVGCPGPNINLPTPALMGMVRILSRQPAGHFLANGTVLPFYTTNHQMFGSALALNAEYLAVSAPYAQEVDGNPNTGGRVFFFHRHGASTFTPWRTLDDVVARPGNLFGWALAWYDATHLLVTGLSNSLDNRTGALYAYQVPSGTSTTFQRLLEFTEPRWANASLTGSMFGVSLAVWSGGLAVGAGTENDDGGNGSDVEAAVFVYSLDVGQMALTLERQLLPPAMEGAAPRFGLGLASSGGALAVTDPGRQRIYMYT